MSDHKHGDETPFLPLTPEYVEELRMRDDSGGLLPFYDSDPPRPLPCADWGGKHWRLTPAQDVALRNASRRRRGVPV